MSAVPKIEATERGIVINKALAWTIVSGLVMGGLWVGTTVGSMSKGIDNLAEQIDSLHEDGTEREARLRFLETERAGATVEVRAVQARITSLAATLNDLQREQREANALLRSISQQLSRRDVP